MRYGRRAHRELDFRAGMRSLAEHRPDLALHSLRAAADDCPASDPAELCRDLYWLAQALLRLDRPELAVKSLASAQKLRPRGFARRLYLRRVNDYGMCRRSSVELDDFYAFYSLHACAFLNRKPNGRFDSNAEKDAVTRLIGDAWRNLLRSGKLDGLSSGKKLALFKSWKMAFPFFGLNQGSLGQGDRCGFPPRRHPFGKRPLPLRLRIALHALLRPQPLRSATALVSSSDTVSALLRRTV